MEWIEQNKEWFLSGAGLFLVTSVVSFFSVLFTLWLKSRAERKKRKKLRIGTSTTKFSLPTSSLDRKEFANDIKVIYEGTEYDNLCIYTVSVCNIGSKAIQNQRIHLVSPANRKVIKTFHEKSLNSIKISKEEHNGEYIYTFERLETDDCCSISFLMELDNFEKIACEPRGVDDIDYIKSGDVESSEIEILVYIVAAFVFSDFIPLFGDFLQGMVVLASAPIILKLYKRHFSNSRKSENSLTISGDVNINEKGVLMIKQ